MIGVKGATIGSVPEERRLIQTGYAEVEQSTPAVNLKDGFHFYATDHLNSTRRLDDWDSSVSDLEINYYYPYGETHTQSGGGEDTDYKFTGYEEDSGIGLYYARARYYNPAIGRFLTPDPAGQFWSPYSYAGNIPHMLTDPDGEFAFAPILVMAAWQGFVDYQINGDLGSSAKAAGISAVGGVVAGAFPAGMGVLEGAGLGAVSGGISGGITATLSGGSFGSGFLSGAASGAVMGGLSGAYNYQKAYPIDIGGGSVWTGSADKIRKLGNVPLGKIANKGMHSAIGKQGALSSTSVSNPVLEGRLRQEEILARMSEVGLGNKFHMHSGETAAQIAQCGDRNDCIMRVILSARPDLNPDNIWTGNAHRFFGNAVPRDMSSLQIAVWVGDRSNDIFGHAGLVRGKLLHDFTPNGLFQRGRLFDPVAADFLKLGVRPSFYDIPGL